MAAPDQPRSKLRFGLLCGGMELSGFERDCLQRILDVPGVELALCVINDAPPQPSSLREKLGRLLRVRGALWPLYQKAFPWNRTSAHRRTDASDLLGAAPRIRCRVTKKGKWSEYFPKEALDEIRAADLDFLLKFSFGIIRGEILTVARYGVWSFHHDDPDRYRALRRAFGKCTTASRPPGRSCSG